MAQFWQWAPAERMRLFRRRRKFRRQVVKVEVDPGEVEALIDRGSGIDTLSELDDWLLGQPQLGRLEQIKTAGV